MEPVTVGRVELERFSRQACRAAWDAVRVQYISWVCLGIASLGIAPLGVASLCIASLGIALRL